MIGPAGTFAAPRQYDELTEEDEAAFMADMALLPISSKGHNVIMEMGFGISISVGEPSDDESHLPAVNFAEEEKCKCGEDKDNCVY